MNPYFFASMATLRRRVCTACGRSHSIGNRHACSARHYRGKRNPIESLFDRIRNFIIVAAVIVLLLALLFALSAVGV